MHLVEHHTAGSHSWLLFHVQPSDSQLLNTLPQHRTYPCSCGYSKDPNLPLKQDFTYLKLNHFGVLFCYKAIMTAVTFNYSRALLYVVTWWGLPHGLFGGEWGFGFRVIITWVLSEWILWWARVTVPANPNIVQKKSAPTKETIDFFFFFLKFLWLQS